jgi:hypothetical protein
MRQRHLRDLGGEIGALRSPITERRTEAEHSHVRPRPCASAAGSAWRRANRMTAPERPWLLSPRNFRAQNCGAVAETFNLRSPAHLPSVADRPL